MKKLLNLAWLDLEMTGLNPEKDVIVEIASIVTDKDLNILAEGPNFVIQQPQEKLKEMNEVVTKIHTDSGLINEIPISNITLREAEIKTISFFEEFCFIGVSPLCGNSIWQDRRFFRKYLPELDYFFNYRIIDVSSVKEIIKRWYPSTLKEFKKKEIHRASHDVRESIAELEYYRKTFFIKEV